MEGVGDLGGGGGSKYCLEMGRNFMQILGSKMTPKGVDFGVDFEVLGD